MNIDVFNGDADGICALVQLRLAEPRQSVLVTGVKRDIHLLSRVQAYAEDDVTVLDISLKENQAHLERVLANGARVFYVDHHSGGVIPNHPKLHSLIDDDPRLCTSILVNHYLEGRFKSWAVVAAFGDNLDVSARELATDLGLKEAQIIQLKNLGQYINYNSYGGSLSDLLIEPSVLYQKLAPYSCAFEFIHAHSECYQALGDAYLQDMQYAAQVICEYVNQHIAVYILPDKPWARRVSGAFANALTHQHPERAHAILTDNLQGGYLVSVRSPLIHKKNADILCSSFPTGGGRKSAAGINHLPIDQLNEFIQRFAQTYS